MPIYEYQCADCGVRVEVLQRMDDPGPSACSHCEGKEMKRAVSAPAFQFKGTGWYVTDYADKSGGEKSESSEGGKAEPSAPASNSDSSESKSTAKAEDTKSSSKETKSTSSKSS